MSDGSTPKSTDARAAILRRRAIFVSTAMAALTGCPPQGQDNKPPITPDGAASSTASSVASSAATTTTSATAGVTPTATASPSATGSAAAGDTAALDGLPSLETPSGINATAQRSYQNLAEDSPRIATAIRARLVSLPGSCDFSQAACESAWAAVARDRGVLTRNLIDLSPRCLYAGKSDVAKAFKIRLEQHHKFLQGKLDALDKAIASALEPGGKEAAEKFELQRKSASRPQVCLRFACSDW